MEIGELRLELWAQVARTLAMFRIKITCTLITSLQVHIYSEGLKVPHYFEPIRTYD